MAVGAKILVTGATGTNGREIVRQLTARGIAARAFVPACGKIAWESPLAQEVEGDLDELLSLQRALDGIEKLFVISRLDPALVRWFANVMEAANAAGVGHVVRFSALGASRDASAEMLRLHAEADAMLMASTLRYTILRPNAFYQTLLASSKMIKAAGRFIAAVGDARQSLVDVRDMAEAAVRVLTEPNHTQHIYALTGPEALSYRELARELTTALGRPVVYQPVTPDDAERTMLDAGLPAWSAHAIAELHAAFATGAFAKLTPDLGELLPRSPRRFADFARDYARAFR